VTKHSIFAFCLMFVSCGLGAQQAVWQPSPGHRQVPIWPGAVPDAHPLTGLETPTHGTCTNAIASASLWVGFPMYISIYRSCQVIIDCHCRAEWWKPVRRSVDDPKNSADQTDPHQSCYQPKNMLRHLSHHTLSYQKSSTIVSFSTCQMAQHRSPKTRRPHLRDQSHLETPVLSANACLFCGWQGCV
jgi:hypothetical protein